MSLSTLGAPPVPSRDRRLHPRHPVVPEASERPCFAGDSWSDIVLFNVYGVKIQLPPRTKTMTVSVMMQVSVLPSRCM